MRKQMSNVLWAVAILAMIPARAVGMETAADGLLQVEQYNFSIHILAMLLVGFGFLMVFVKKYGYSATTGTYLVVATGIPLYLLLRSWGGLSAEPVAPDSVKSLLFAEFACASALIAMGAVLGRLRLHQYAMLAALVLPGIAKAQLVGIGFTVIFAFGAGTVGGYLIKLAGAKSTAYVDDEFVNGEPTEPQAADNDEALAAASAPIA